jgi:acetoin utilization deacetylase AcuC-like enzyme/GNAT superfamily N-acetyltransferase
MIRIRRVYGTDLPAGRARVEAVQEIFRNHFAAVAAYAEKIPDQLNHPFKYGHHAILLVSETGMGQVTGFSLLLHFQEINASLLDFMAVRRGIKGGGIGGALYEASRDYLARIGSRGLYLEALPDDPEQVRDPDLLEQNRRRMQFYERYGARPIINTAYETPIGPYPAPYLLFDGLGREEPLRRAECRAAMKFILERKYSHLVGPEYVRKVVRSVVDDPVKLRPPRYIRAAPHVAPTPSRLEKAFVLVASEEHRIHHVRERGYVERPARVDALVQSLMPTMMFERLPARHFGEEPIRAVHDADFVTYLKVVCEKLSPKRPVYPYVFPIRRPERKPKELAVRAGYYCIDTFTPLDRNAYLAARAAVGVAMTACEEVLRGRPVAYAVCRPPGHHAEGRAFGGFCYCINAAIAANRLAREGKVALLDIDLHHGNGSQRIFWQRSDVFTQSINGHPNYAYPYFSGFADEYGEGPGRGFNRNYPLPENSDDDAYLAVFGKAVERIERFKPAFLVVSFGLDTMKGDPTGAFTLTVTALEKIGRRLGALGLPMLVVQEGGYSIRNLRRGAPGFFRGVAKALHEDLHRKPPPVAGNSR